MPASADELAISEKHDSAVRHVYIEALRLTGRTLTQQQVARHLSLTVDQVELSLHRLAGNHAVVLHPHICEPWVIHPYSTSPTAIWVEGSGRGWWAPCIWCGLGVAVLAGGNATLHARLGGEAQDVDVEVRNGQVVQDDLIVHFAIPPRAAWDNVHHFCSTVLPFRSQQDVADWSERHGIDQGQTAPISQVLDLARHWYGHHCDTGWRKWTTAQASGIFRDVGLTGPFWDIDATGSTF